jgi:NADH-quinone oxidoreductase subunit H
MFYLSEYMEVVTSSMLIVTLFLGGWELPFLHRDGITISFGDTTLAHLPIPHIWMWIFGVLAFFGKAAFVCWMQTFVRWSLPRFRYDQLMKLGWKVLLPASLANILVTGVVYLAIDKAGAGAASGLKFAGDVTQAILAVGMTYYLIRALVGWFTPSKHKKTIVGSSAMQAEELGGTKATPMQA